MESAVYQSYANWSFIRAVGGEPSTPRDFILYLLGRRGPVPAPPERSAPPSVPNVPWLGRLDIPSIDLSVIFLDGTDAATLMRGAGHIPGTALPGQPGNVGLAAHRDTFFRHLG